jgi:secretin/TonB-like protein
MNTREVLAGMTNDFSRALGGLSRFVVIVAVACLTEFGSSTAADVDASVRKATSIPAEELVPALKTLARERGLQVVFQSEVVGSAHTQGALGSFTAAQALEQLLSGTGLTYRYLDDKTVTILPSSPSSSTPNAAAVHSPTPSRPDPTLAKDASKALPQVTVETQRDALRERMYEFVRGITRDTRSYRESLARWRVPLCFLVAGLPKAEDEFVLERLSQIAISAGARLAPQDCRPDFFVVLSSDPDSLLKEWAARNARLFGDGTPAEIRRFLSPPRPRAVRVWYNAAAVGTDGMPVTSGVACGMPLRMMASLIQFSCSNESSRAAFYDVLAFSSVVVIVDTRRLKDLSFGQLADYVAMVGLTQIDLDDDVGGFPTILQLFAASRETAPAGLSTWDQAFLSALYHSDQGSRLQRSQIVVRMLHDVSPRP